MELTEILSIIGENLELGFPVIMCGGFFWYIIRLNTLHSSEIKSLREEMAARDEIQRVESQATREVISELKVAITELTTELKERE